ncbi:hypothetical protein AX17_002790 [Amanita inopinata Kibby_2008]|nr:hypothetical protein AX17_002790 [Amanita inopinata Kibby_2008]
MAFSQAHGFTINDGSFIDVQGNYMRKETNSNSQRISIDDSSQMTNRPTPHWHVPDMHPHLVASGTSNESRPIGAQNSNVSGNQVNNVITYITVSSGGFSPIAQSPATTGNVDTALDEEVKNCGQTLDWRRSIVDLLKVLRIDSSYNKRINLAHSLGYDVDVNNSCDMNMWLHGRVMRVVKDSNGNLRAVRNVLSV